MTLQNKPHIYDHQLRKSAARPPCILCVDDDPDLQSSIELRLRSYRVVVRQAYFGMQGIAEASRLRPDLILMDQSMPQGNGEHLLEVVKRSSVTCGIPVVVLTGMRDPALKKRLMLAGADAFLSKPVLFDDLLHCLSRFVDIQPR